eukprot:gnl/MRDRNA2_/MRDRNA2_120319_c0_seq1.p1 gnl/MRDRNA2_/MRDRNA2_120319_c0~~gnl/MRDRNA2_/MRDRNA2_120319_c0_seq1.p1  ORF type:complete len:847 (-),score=173.18 gnl/MRDRNA2_/MRDRNA2_120319_c0_seq1:6-2546(-)
MWQCGLPAVGLLLLMMQINEGNSNRHRFKKSMRSPSYPSFRSRFGLHQKRDRNVSLTKALQLLKEKGLSDETRATLEMRRHKTGGRLRQGLSHKGVEEAVAELNKMRLSTLLELDVELSRCDTYHEQSEIQLSSVQDEKYYLAHMEAAADTHILDSRARLEEATAQIDDLHRILADHEEKCKEEIAVGKENLLVMEANLKSSTSILAMTKCKPSLLQCGGSSHPAAQSMVRAANDAQKVREELVFTQMSSKHHKHRRSGHRQAHHHHDLRKHHFIARHHQNAVRESALQVQSIMARIHALVNGSTSNTHVPKHLEDMDPYDDPNGHKHRCIIDNNPNCEGFVDSIMSMVGDVYCKNFDMENTLQKTMEKCASLKQDYAMQIDAVENNRIQRQNVALAEATAFKNEDAFQASMKTSEINNVNSDFMVHMHQCEVSLAKSHEAICGIEALRSELFVMESQVKPLQDCEVSDWVFGQCSQSCGGGERIKTREILVNVNGGSSCPPLEEREPCGNQPCPVNCVLGDWEEWSACNVDCGTGFRERSRQVLVQDDHGGEPCSMEHISATCNTESCDHDCLLSEWMEWSGCSKACGGGFQRRIKEITAPAKGSGMCPPHRQKTEEFRRCNSKECPKKDIKCNSKVDVVLLIDGSGNAGKDGFTKTVAFAEKLVGAFKTGDDLAQVGVVQYSGPKSWTDLDSCLKTGAEASCNLKVVSQLSKDGSAVASAVKGLTAWPKGSTFTSGALSMGHSLLQEGRKDAQSVVVTFMTGMPNFPCRTEAAAEDVRKSARLMFVPVNVGAPVESETPLDLDTLAQWASHPARENVIPIAHLTDLEKPEKLRELVYAICPKVE